MFGATLHQRGNAIVIQLALELGPQSLHEFFALDALFIEQAGCFLVSLRFKKTEGQVFHFPLDLPYSQPVGQRRKHMQRLMRQRRRRRLLDSGEVAQGLQARGQPQHDHAQIARERQQHLAHVLGLGGRIVLQLRMGGGTARLSLHLDQLGGFDGQRGIVGAEGLGNHLLRLVEMLTRVDQIGGGLHGLRAANHLQDGSHRVGVRQDVFAGVQRFGGNQRLGKSARPRQSLRLLRQAVSGRRHDGSRVAMGCQRGTWRTCIGLTAWPHTMAFHENPVTLFPHIKTAKNPLRRRAGLLRST